MQKYCSVFWTESVLKEGKRLLEETEKKFKDIYLVDKGLIWNSDLVEFCELENMSL